MKRYLLPEKGNFYKANLHCHSTDSDGEFTPAELIAGYKKAGYSILCLSEHDKFITREDLCTGDFLLLNGLEVTGKKNDPTAGRFVHMGAIARSRDITSIPALPEYPACDSDDAEYTALVNKMAADFEAAGFLTIYNHMRWSMENETDLAGYTGFSGMEIHNYFSELMGIEDWNFAPFLEQIRRGRKLLAFMGDDNHNRLQWPGMSLYGLDRWDTSFGAWIVVRCDELTYESVMAAIEQGDFYCSNGPEISEAYIEDNVLHVFCSPARNITVATAGRRGKCNFDRNGAMTHGVFELTGNEEFVIVTVTDARGRRAVTQPGYLCDD
ncbi:MAG: hypothetical protein IKM31_04620 [Oscillospiraceae bacterium]|nr:hypothetical protein [Oscillospiraceae bacterium]